MSIIDLPNDDHILSDPPYREGCCIACSGVHKIICKECQCCLEHHARGCTKCGR